MTTKAQESKLGLDFVCSQNLTFYLHKMELVNENIYPKKKKKISYDNKQLHLVQKRHRKLIKIIV